MTKFEKESEERVASYSGDNEITARTKEFQHFMLSKRYVYNFFWLGRPIIQIPQDLEVYQEIIWKVKPDLIIETGVAHGGSLIYSASILALLEYCGLIQEGNVVGIDIKIYPDNYEAITTHPLGKKIRLIEGSSTSDEVIAKVASIASGRRVLVLLDSNHTHDHVLEELRYYSEFVSTGSYCIVGDTGIEDTPPDLIGDRPWGKGNSPLSAVDAFLNNNNSYTQDRYYENKVWLTASRGGFLLKL